MSRRVDDWFAARTSTAAQWPITRLLDLKAESTVAVVIPARNEARTVADVVGPIATELSSVVDDLVVMDSLSTDETGRAAADAGATVHSVADVRADLGVRKGKGEALWKSLFVTDADVLVFVDADLTHWGTHFIRGLIGPLLAWPEVRLVRGFYDRLPAADASATTGGGRVTELVARPWLAMHRPELSKVVQPLAGEWSIRRGTFADLSIPVEYGVELSTLLDVHERFGLDAIAQVDLGVRGHRSKDLRDLTAMAAELLAVGESRRDTGSRTTAWSTDFGVTQPTASRDWVELDVTARERPPAASVPGYRG